MNAGTRRARWQRAQIAGGRPLDPERWSEIVDQAAAGLRSTTMSLVSTSPTIIEHRPHRMEIVEPGDVVMRAKDVLGLEMTLLMAEQLSDEIRALVDDPDIDDGRRLRMRSRIDRARAAVERALKRRGES